MAGLQTTFRELVTTAKCYQFTFQHPGAPQCNEQNSECGFLLKVTPTSQEEAGKFNVVLVTDDDEYPGDIHCHKDVISVTNMHLVVEWYSGIRWCNTGISWWGRPEYTWRGDVVWGGWMCDTTPARFVVYYDVRQCNTQPQCKS